MLKVAKVSTIRLANMNYSNHEDIQDAISYIGNFRFNINM